MHAVIFKITLDTTQQDKVFLKEVDGYQFTIELVKIVIPRYITVNIDKPNVTFSRWETTCNGNTFVDGANIPFGQTSNATQLTVKAYIDFEVTNTYSITIERE